VTVLLFAAGVIMLRRQTDRRARERGGVPMPAASFAARSVDGELLGMEGAEP
jgi:hypothetical protein